MYPLELLSSGMNISPLFGSQLSGMPYVFDFSSNNSEVMTYDTKNFAQFQHAVFSELSESGRSWGIGQYLEERAHLLRNYPQMIEEGRFYHAGLDIVAPENFTLFAPLDSLVYQIGKEEGLGNYGGYVILRHAVSGNHFYSMYGHLHAEHIVTTGQSICAGEEFGRIGGANDSGGWFTHTHLQIITNEAMEAERCFEGYVTAEGLTKINSLFPSPYCLFRYETSGEPGY